MTSGFTSVSILVVVGFSSGSANGGDTALQAADHVVGHGRATDTVEVLAVTKSRNQGSTLALALSRNHAGVKSGSLTGEELVDSISGVGSDLSRGEGNSEGDNGSESDHDSTWMGYEERERQRGERKKQKLGVQIAL